MLWKAMKLGAVATSGAVVLGGLVFGSDLASYLRSSRNSVAMAVHDNIPIDFQIRRARDLMAATEPEMRRNIRLMAEEEVDIALLKEDIAKSAQSLEKEKGRLQKLRTDLGTGESSFTVGECTYSREQMVQELTRRFKFYEDGETGLAQKKQILENRQKALAAAGTAMEEAKGRRAVLAGQVEALEGRERLLAATSSGAAVRFDQSSLAQAERVVADVSRTLDVEEHARAREAKFEEPAIPDVVNEKELLGKVDEHFGAKASASASASTGAVVVK